MKRKLFSLAIYITLIVVIVVFLVRHFHVNDFCVIKPDLLYASGQPRRMDYTRLLYNYHIATIVNVRSSSEHREQNWYNEELTWVRNNAVRYIEIPIGKTYYFPDEDTQERFLAVMGDKNNLPVLLHGGGDDERVAMLTAVWLRKAMGYNPEKTITEVKKIIDDRHLSEEEIAFINNLK